MANKILVTGGAGYIGSFIVRQLSNEGHETIILDDLSSGHRQAVPEFPLHKLNLLTDTNKINSLFQKEKFDGVIHMASFIRAGESYQDPLKYFNNNIKGVLNLLETMVRNNVNKFIFSSSAGVYGIPKKLPIKEDDPKYPENPYGETKAVVERILHWTSKAHDLRFASIRYFNAAGAALDGSIGEDHPEESHIIPLAIKAALDDKQFTIFGNDYNTPDGTCVRDYVHVLDLARSHTSALDYLANDGQSDYFNAGAGSGYSNSQIVDEIKKATVKDFKINIGPRREGDPDALFASINKIKKVLKWTPKYNLKEIIASAVKWHSTHPQGYG